ncbi:hypothetical protein CLU97_1734 [Chryseobacterium sp. 7]|nr:hypothetical protein CLU97_1734 [Chryseobacterium sp. 7]
MICEAEFFDQKAHLIKNKAEGVSNPEAPKK